MGEIKQFISSKYPAVARRLIKPISAHDLTDPAYHWFGSKTDFVYQDIHPDIIKAFLATKKVKKFVLPSSVEARRRALQKNPNKEDRIMSFDHIRKYHDALLFGSQERGASMSPTYTIEMKKFLASHQKRICSQKKSKTS